MSKTYTRNELQENREQIIQDHYAKTPRSAKKRTLTKKERKVLGIGKDRGIARINHVRVSPSKASVVVRNVMNKQVDEALAILQYTPRAAAPILAKLIEQAVSNAVNNNNLNREDLHVVDCQIGPGSTLRRFKPRGKGAAGRILKRTSNITLTVKEKTEEAN
ncbi:MAG: 50S ribosomal protein L22 [Clostridiaceae bacterium]|jgi:large subunit ribosomal protein L22|nr:50S ribosomal protein L22 [Bacillota bacterium]NLN51779.1 50S ribosomal protein L22 [Clostridiaceae bacterium]